MVKRIIVHIVIIAFVFLLTGCNSIDVNNTTDENIEESNIFNPVKISNKIGLYYENCKENYEEANCELEACNLYEPKEKSRWIINGTVYGTYNNGDNYQLTIFESDGSSYNTCLFAYSFSEKYEAQKELLSSYKIGDSINLECRYINLSGTDVDRKIYQYNFDDCNIIDE